MRVPAVVALLLACLLAPAHPAAQPALTLGARDDRLTVDGNPRFLVLVSYFDALDAAHLDDDVAWLRQRADGVRLFVNWWDFDRARRCATRFSDRTVMRVNDAGHVDIRSDRLKRLQEVLRTLRAAGLVVDVTFSYEAVKGLSDLRGDADGVVCGTSSSITNRVRLEEYAAGIRAVVRALASPEYDHVFFDLQNEVSGGWTRLSVDEVRRLADVAREAAPGRLLTASSFSPDAARQVALVRQARLDVLTAHDWPRSAGWETRTGQLVTSLRGALGAAGLRRPILLGEPPSSAYGGGAAVFQTALERARKAGAAGWTLHTRAGFRLDDARFVDGLDAPARAFLDGLARPAR